MRLFAALALTLLAFSSGVTAVSALEPIQARVEFDQPGPVISRQIYGQVVEHLGRGVYDGTWVGPDSPIPNTRGIRTDVVEALREGGYGGWLIVEQRHSAARVVRKPGSTEMVNVPAKKTVKLSAGSKLKAAANS